MPGTRITDQQVRLYMNNRKHHPQKLAAAKSGMSERTARRVEHDAGLPSQQPRRYWRSRPDPFADVWETQIVPLLRSSPKLKAVTLLRKLQEDHPERFPDSMRRTFERHVSQWRALEGPNKEVFFPQTYLPGARGLSDFTHMDKLRVTIGGVPFSHLLYHFVLAFSRWEYASVVDGGESFQALATGLQNALWQADAPVFPDGDLTGRGHPDFAPDPSATQSCASHLRLNAPPFSASRFGWPGPVRSRLSRALA